MAQVNNFEVIPLFATPLYRTNLGSLAKDMRDFIENIEFERMPAGNGDYSVNKYILDCPELAPLKEKIMSKVNHFVYDYLDCKKVMTFKIENSWVNRHYKDDYSQPHWHGSSILSGVYYIEIEKDTGDIIFHKDRTHMNLFNPLVELGYNFEDTGDQSKMNIYNIQNFGMQPLKNDLLLFPSQVSHSVDPNLKGKTRYTLAFNLFPRGTSGGAINTLTV